MERTCSSGEDQQPASGVAESPAVPCCDEQVAEALPAATRDPICHLPWVLTDDKAGNSSSSSMWVQLTSLPGHSVLQCAATEAASLQPPPKLNWVVAEGTW